MVSRIIRDIPLSSSVQRRTMSSQSCLHLNTGFLTTQQGFIKIAQAVFSAISQTLLINYGTGVSLILGNAYTMFLTNASACLLTTCLLLVSYVISENTHRAIRKSIFEIVFNVVAAWLYIGASAYLMFMTSLLLWPLYLITPFFQAYPALTAAASFGFLLAAIHALDAYFAVKCFRGK